MPININDLDIVPSENDPHADLEQQLNHLQRQVQALIASHRELVSYCQSLEEACRSSFAECPGVSPFPKLLMSP
jgi:hypothetical protein